MVAQVAGHGFADIGREGKLVVIAALATHLEHRDPPVDIIQFQADHLACSQSKAGQQKNDGEVASGGGSVPPAGMDNLFDFRRCQVLRHLGEPPLRHSRDRCCKVTVCLCVPEEKPEEGAQGRHHHLGHFGTTRASVSQEETREVIGNHLPKTERGLPEAANEEKPDVAPEYPTKVTEDRPRSFSR